VSESVLRYQNRELAKADVAFEVLSRYFARQIIDILDATDPADRELREREMRGLEQFFGMDIADKATRRDPLAAVTTRSDPDEGFGRQAGNSRRSRRRCEPQRGSPDKIGGFPTGGAAMPLRRPPTVGALPGRPAREADSRGTGRRCCQRVRTDVERICNFLEALAKHPRGLQKYHEEAVRTVHDSWLDREGEQSLRRWARSECSRIWPAASPPSTPRSAATSRRWSAPRDLFGIVGTPTTTSRPWRSSSGTPEQFGQTGAWTDVYALAITLGEVLTQRPALEGSAAAMLTQCLDPKKRPTPRALGLEIDDDLDDVFRRALAVDPRDRTRSVEDFWGELEDALDLPRSLSAGRASMPLIAMPVRWDDDLDEPPRASSLSVKPPGPSKAPSAPPPVARAPELPSLELPAKPTAPEPPPPADAPTPRPTPPPPEPAPAPAPTAERSSSPQPVETSSPTEAAPAPAAAAPAAAPQPSAAPAAARQARPPAAYDVAAVAVGLMIAVVAADAYAGLALPVAWICTALALVAGIVVAVRFLR
jgi:serine/threonine protein kinase